MKRLTTFAIIASLAALAFSCKKPDVPVPSEKVDVMSVKIVAEATTVNVGATLQLSATVSPDNATDKTVTWTSSVPGVATVSSTGLVTGVDNGQTVITAAAGGMTDRVTIKVETPVDFNDGKVHFKEFVSYTEESSYINAILPLPEGYTFSGAFDLKDLFAGFPDGTITFELAPKSQQNGEAQRFYEELQGNLASNGMWTRNARFGVDFNTDSTSDKDGIGIIVKANGTKVYTIWFRIPYSIPSKVYQDGSDHVKLTVEGLTQQISIYTEFGSLEMEYGNEDNWEEVTFAPGVNELNVCKMWNNGPEQMYLYSPYYKGNEGDYKFLDIWPALSFSDDTGEILYNNGTSIVLTKYGKALCGQSEGLKWSIPWFELVHSAHWELPEEERPAGSNAEHYGPQYIEVDDQILEKFGIYVEDGFLKTTSAYTGHGFLAHFRLYLTTDYDDVRYILGPRYLTRTFFNRRWTKAGATDPAV